MSSLETVGIIGLGTIPVIPTLLAVPLTQLVLRRIQRIAPIAVLDAEAVINIDRAPARQLLEGILLTLELAPAAAEGIVSIQHARLIGVGDGLSFVARNDRLTRAAMTTHLMARILRWVSKPYNVDRCMAAASACWTVAFHCDAEGCIDTVARFEKFLASHPSEPVPREVVVTA